MKHHTLMKIHFHKLAMSLKMLVKTQLLVPLFKFMIQTTVMKMHWCFRWKTIAMVFLKSMLFMVWLLLLHRPLMALLRLILKHNKVILLLRVLLIHRAVFHVWQYQLLSMMWTNNQFRIQYNCTFVKMPTMAMRFPMTLILPSGMFLPVATKMPIHGVFINIQY